jgi:hypothetical protein
LRSVHHRRRRRGQWPTSSIVPPAIDWALGWPALDSE